MNPRSKVRLVTLVEALIAASVCLLMGTLPRPVLIIVLTGLALISGWLAVGLWIDLKATRKGLDIDPEDLKRLRKMHKRDDG